MIDFVAIDMEKLDDSPLSVCEVGLVKYKNGEFYDEFHAYIQPVTGFSRNLFGTTKLRHITDEIIRTSEDFRDVYFQMKGFVGDSILVCYNKGADLNYLYYNEKNSEVSNLYASYVDVKEIVKKGLEDTYEEIFGKKLTNHHHALDDARHAAEIFNYLQKQNDIKLFIKDHYIPDKEKPKADTSKYATVSSEGLDNDDRILDNYDFKGKICVISGNSDYRDSIKRKLESMGVKVCDSISGKTNAFIISDDVGPSKKEKGFKEKANRPDSFHIFSQIEVAKKLGLA